MKEAVQLSATPMTTDMWGDESFVFLVLDLRGADVQIAKPPLYNDHRVMDCNITQKCSDMSLPFETIAPSNITKNIGIAC